MMRAPRSKPHRHRAVADTASSVDIAYPAANLLQSSRRTHSIAVRRIRAIAAVARTRAGEDISPEGCHRGELAGLSPEEHERAVGVAEEATEVYGVVSVEDAFEELNLLGETPLSLEEFREALWMTESDDLHSIRLWSFEGDDYLAHWELWDETVARDTARDFDIEGVIESVQRDLPRRKHLYEFDRSGRTFLTLFDTPAAQALKAYIDERIPDSAADRFSPRRSWKSWSRAESCSSAPTGCRRRRATTTRALAAATRSTRSAAGGDRRGTRRPGRKMAGA